MMGIAVIRYLEIRGMNHAKSTGIFTRIWNKFSAKSYGLLPRSKRQEARTNGDGSTDKATERTSNTETRDGQC